MNKHLLLTLPLLATLTGCGPLTHLTHYNNNERLGDSADRTKAPTAVFIDAKQRAVIARPDSSGNYRVCSEPSPDALSALASSFGFAVSAEDKASLSQAFSLTEGASSIGLRTQSIQLMRDALFRLCEGYMSGALSESAFESRFSEVQSSMVAVLAIEQLTGVHKAPPVGISGNANSGAAEQADKYTTLSEATRTKIGVSQKAVDAATKEEADKKAAHTQAQLEATTKKGELDKAQTAFDEANAKDPKPAAAELNALKTARDKLAAEHAELAKLADEAGKASSEATTKLAGAKKTLADQQAVYEKYEAARLAALGGSLATSTKVEIATAEASPSDSAAVAAIASSVERIVKSVYEIDYMEKACVTTINAATSIEGGSSSAQKSMLAACVERLQADVRARTLRTEAAALRLEDIKATQDAGAILDPSARTARDAEFRRVDEGLQ